MSDSGSGPKGGLQKEGVSIDREKIVQTMKKLNYELVNNMRAACRVVTETDAGSGVLIDGRSLGFPHACLLTNQHVIETAEQAASGTVYFNYENNDSTRWLKAKLDPSSGFAAHKDANLGLNFCIVALKIDASIPRLSEPRTLDDAINDDERARCPAPVSLNPEAAIKNDMSVAVWQHPARGFKKISQLKILSVTKTTLNYRNDPESGSSGSPIYNNAAELVGIHHAGGTLRKKTPNPNPNANPNLDPNTNTNR